MSNFIGPPIVLPPKRKLKLRIPDPNKKKKFVRFTKREVDVLALRAAGYSNKEAGIMAGYPPETAAKNADNAYHSAKKRLSKNERLSDYLEMCGASLEKVARVCNEGMDANTAVVLRGGDYIKGADGKLRKITTAQVTHVPDHRARLEAAKFTAEIHNAMPDKKIITEHRTFEARVAVIAEIQQNPAESIALIQALLVVILIFGLLLGVIELAAAMLAKPARPKAPPERRTSTSMVGLPRESMISRAVMAVMVVSQLLILLRL